MWQRLPLSSWYAQPLKEVQIDSNYGSYTIVSRDGRMPPPPTTSSSRSSTKVTVLIVALKLVVAVVKHASEVASIKPHRLNTGVAQIAQY